MILVSFSSLRYKNSTRNHSKHHLTLKFPLSYPRNLKFRSIVKKKKSCKNKIRGKHDSGGFSSFRRRLVPSVTYAGIWITSTGGSRKFYFTAMLLRETGRKKAYQEPDQARCSYEPHQRRSIATEARHGHENSY